MDDPRFAPVPESEMALIRECAKLILANEALVQKWSELPDHKLRQSRLILSRNSWRARALAAEGIIKDVLRGAAIPRQSGE